MTKDNVVTLKCGCFFIGRKFYTSAVCKEHSDKDEPYDSMESIEGRWRCRYWRLTRDVRKSLIHQQTQDALRVLDELSIKPTMSAEELTKLTRG